MLLLPLICSLSLAAALPSPSPAETWDQVVQKPPVIARLRVDPREHNVATPVVLRLEAVIPALSTSEALATGQPAQFHPIPQFLAWKRIPHLPLDGIEPGQEQRTAEGVTVFRWVCCWQPALPGNFTLPPLRMRLQPVLPELEPADLEFAPVPVTITPFITGDLAAAEPRPPISTLPRQKFSLKQGLLLTFIVLAWIIVRLRYARWRRSRLPVSSTPGSPQAQALAALENCRTCQEAYPVLRRFLLDTWGVDPAKLSTADLRDSPLIAPAASREELATLVDALQAGAFASVDQSLSPDLHKRLREFLHSFDA